MHGCASWSAPLLFEYITKSGFLVSRPILGYTRLRSTELGSKTNINGVARTLKKLCTFKGDYWFKQRFYSIAALFKIVTSLKGENLLPNSFLYEQFLRVWKITFTTLGDLP